MRLYQPVGYRCNDAWHMLIETVIGTLLGLLIWGV
jgi:hypothetical protein